MAGKTISAYTDLETAERFAWIAKREQRKKSQLAGSAVKLFVNLPEQARTAWNQLEALGTSDELTKMSQEITRVLLHAQYEMAKRQLLEEMKPNSLGRLETEDELLDAAVSITQ
jgi:hypothetical protein